MHNLERPSHGQAPVQVTSSPRTFTLPPDFGINPETALIKLVFPQPEGPTKTTNSPFLFLSLYLEGQ
ncbi:MAG: hypothetical protein CM15mP117_20700 [Alphaproteobacteria bacterium]|nr:MAG: hypothetical protein CM15mP117_20700 [Alphaproteobacteria bacterium]